MARTAITYSAWVANAGFTDPAGTAVDVTNDHIINAAEPERTIIRVTNTSGATKTVTVRAGANPPAWAAGLGNLDRDVAATTGVEWIGPLESGRFLQADGSLWVDIPTGHTGNITAFKIPRSV